MGDNPCRYTVCWSLVYFSTRPQLTRGCDQNHHNMVFKDCPAAVLQSNACRARLHSAVCGVAGDWLTVLPAVLDIFVRLQHIYFLNQGQDLGM